MIGKGEYKIQDDSIYSASKTTDPLDVLLDLKGKQAGRLEFRLTI